MYPIFGLLWSICGECSNKLARENSINIIGSWKFSRAKN